MSREKIIEQLMEAEQRLNLMTGRRGAYTFGQDGNSISKVLRILGSSVGDIHPTDICRKFDVTTPRITTILNEMEKRDLIRRKISKEDRRKIVVVLTKKGSEALAEKKLKEKEFFSRIYGKLGKDGAEALLRSMKAYEEVYTEMKEEDSQEK